MEATAPRNGGQLTEPAQSSTGIGARARSAECSDASPPSRLSSGKSGAGQPAESEPGRARWRFYRDRGYQVTTHDIAAIEAKR
jgi:hypothetical protein